MEEFTVEDYQAIFKDMRRDAEYYLEKSKVLEDSETMLEAAKEALSLITDAENEADLFELSVYYNDIRGALRECEDEDD